MNQSQREYIDYLNRQIRNTTTTIQCVNKLMVNREAGKSYGCSEMEMDEAVKVAEREGME